MFSIEFLSALVLRVGTKRVKLLISKEQYQIYGYGRLQGPAYPQAHCVFLQLHSHLMILALRSTIDGGSEGR